MKELLFYVLVFYAGLFVGFCIRSWIQRRTNYNGTIYVTKNPDKTLYSLELDDDPELIQFRKKVILKVDTSPPKLPIRE
jgi:hypothetical protein